MFGPINLDPHVPEDCSFESFQDLETLTYVERDVEPYYTYTFQDLDLPSPNGSPVSDEFLKLGEASQIKVPAQPPTQRLPKFKNTNNAINSRNFRARRREKLKQMEQRIAELENENKELKLKLQLANRRRAILVREA